MQSYDKLFIGGEWVAPATAATIDVISPHSEEIVGRVPEAREADIPSGPSSRPRPEALNPPNGALNSSRAAALGGLRLVAHCWRSWDQASRESRH